MYVTWCSDLCIHCGVIAVAAAAKSLQSCLTLCDPIDSSPPGSPIPEILQARTPEWVAISFSNAWKWKVTGKSLSHVWLFATPGTAAYQPPPSVGFAKQEYWSGVPLPSPGVIATSKLISKSIASHTYLFFFSSYHINLHLFFFKFIHIEQQVPITPQPTPLVTVILFSTSTLLTI